MSTRSVVLLAMLAVTGTALAQQNPSPPPAPQWHGHHQWKATEWRQKMEQRRMERLAVLLDLSAAQRQQVQAIFSDEHARMKTAMQQVERAMEQARAAHEAAHKETVQRLSSVLTPAQMRKLEVLMPKHRMMAHRMMMRGMMMHERGHDMGDGMEHGMEHGMEGAPPPPPGPGPGPQ